MSVSRFIRVTNRFMGTPFGIITTVALMLLLMGVYFTVRGNPTQQQIKDTADQTNQIVEAQSEQLDATQKIVEGQRDIIEAQSDKIDQLEILMICLLADHGEFGIISDEAQARCQKASEDAQTTSQAQEPPKVLALKGAM